MVTLCSLARRASPGPIAHLWDAQSVSLVRNMPGACRIRITPPLSHADVHRVRELEGATLNSSDNAQVITALTSARNVMKHVMDARNRVSEGSSVQHHSLVNTACPVRREMIAITATLISCSSVSATVCPLHAMSLRLIRLLAHRVS